MGKVKLIDASFIWTEPHSMRLKVKLTVQGEVLNGAILQQSFVVEFVVERNMCPTCCRQAANPNSWVGCAQVRQHVPHKRTFFYLEQLILKHCAHEACINVKEMHEGVDFYFANRNHALKFIDFLQSVVPIKYRADKQLVSHNEHNSTYNYKYTFSVEIAPICKDDLIFLSPKVSSSFGGLGPLVLCTRVTNTITLIDPATLRHVQLETGAFWRTPLRPIVSSRQLVEYVVLDVEPIDGSSYAHSGGGGGGKGGTKKLALAEVQLARVTDFGANDKTVFARTHLGNLLHPGDHAFGYDLVNANAASDDLDKAVQRGLALPDVVLVRKSYEEKRRAKKAKGAVRAWKLERMAVEQGDEVGAAMASGGGGGGGGNRGKGGQDAEAQDMERFLEELEEDPEMRSKVALYKDHEAMALKKKSNGGGGGGMGEEDGDEEDSDDDSLPEVPLEELLEDLAAMQLAEGDGDDGSGGGDDMMIE